jgi:pimeloyl-ACP methyl ester carboxylesterase
VIADSGRMPARIWQEALAALLRYEPCEGAIHDPTLVIGGEEDTVFDRYEQQALAASLRHATLRLLPGVGHSPHWESPDQFAAEVTEFLGAGVATATGARG